MSRRLVILCLVAMVTVVALFSEARVTFEDELRDKRTDYFDYYDGMHGPTDIDCSDLEGLCKPTPHSPQCSNNGVCFCGECLCDPVDRRRPLDVYEGIYCQCNSYGCPRVKGKLCSGRGYCDCGRCVCEGGHYGEACECEESTGFCAETAN